MVHSRFSASSTKVYGLPWRRRLSDLGLSRVSSRISRQAAARGEASVDSSVPDMGASLCLGEGESEHACKTGGGVSLKVVTQLVCADVGAAPEERDPHGRGGVLHREVLEDEAADDGAPRELR